MQPISYQGTDAMSFKQLDELNGLPKGSSFRAFKRVRHELLEGVDFFYLSSATHRTLIDELRQDGLVYRSTEHLVLVTRQGYEKMLRYGATAFGQQK